MVNAINYIIATVRDWKSKFLTIHLNLFLEEKKMVKTEEKPIREDKIKQFLNTLSKEDYNKLIEFLKFKIKSSYEPSFVERGGSRFYYIDVGSETHGRISFRLWISSALLVADRLKGKNKLVFPCSALIHKTAKGNYVLRPSDDHITVDIYVRCGFRGGSTIKFEEKPVIALAYAVYSSPLGSTGISRGYLASFKKTQFPITYSWSRSGRLYGSPASGRTMVTVDGEEREAPPLDEELEELL